MSAPMVRQSPSERALGALQIVLGYVWLAAGWEKVASSEFVNGMGGTLAHFASENPFGWYVSFLNNVAVPNATTLGYLVEWGEVAVGIGLIVLTLAKWFVKNDWVRAWVTWPLLAALVAGLLLNANFYFAAGWTSPGMKTANIVMFWAQAALVYAWVSAMKKR